jgi:hypothetical protein
MVETDEVIDMGMRDEYIRDLEELPSRQVVVGPQVEEETTALPRDIDVNRRVLEGIVDQAWVEYGLHAIDQGLAFRKRPSCTSIPCL